MSTRGWIAAGVTGLVVAAITPSLVDVVEVVVSSNDDVTNAVTVGSAVAGVVTTPAPLLLSVAWLIVMIAVVVAIAASGRRRPRLVGGVLMALMGVGLMWRVVAIVQEGDVIDETQAQEIGLVLHRTVHLFPVIVSLAGALIAVVAGVAIVRSGRVQPAPSTP